MTPSWPACAFWLIAGLWLLRASRLPDERWGRLTANWPVPWPQMSPQGRRALRVLTVMMAICCLLLSIATAPGAEGTQ